MIMLRINIIRNSVVFFCIPTDHLAHFWEGIVPPFRDHCIKIEGFVILKLDCELYEGAEGG